MALWGLHDAVLYNAPSFYQLVAGVVFILDGLAVILAVVTGITLRKTLRVRVVP